MDELTQPERMLLEMFPALLAVVENPNRTTVRPEILRLVRLVTGTRVRRDPSAPYAAAMVTMMDREDGEMKAIVYPVTRVELMNIYDDRMPTRFRAFQVDENGWTEEQ